MNSQKAEEEEDTKQRKFEIDFNVGSKYHVRRVKPIGNSGHVMVNKDIGEEGDIMLLINLSRLSDHKINEVVENPIEFFEGLSTVEDNKK